MLISANVRLRWWLVSREESLHHCQWAQGRQNFIIVLGDAVFHEGTPLFVSLDTASVLTLA